MEYHKEMLRLFEIIVRPLLVVDQAKEVWVMLKGAKEEKNVVRVRLQNNLGSTVPKTTSTS